MISGRFEENLHFSRPVFRGKGASGEVTAHTDEQSKKNFVRKKILVSSISIFKHLKNSSHQLLKRPLIINIFKVVTVPCCHLILLKYFLNVNKTCVMPKSVPKSIKV